MKNENEKKKWKVTFSEDALKNFNNVSDSVVKEIEKMVKGFKTGNLDPANVGKPVNWLELEVKLRCPECKSIDVEWLLDRNSKEVTFHCLKCSESFWMTKKEYEHAVKKHPECII